MPAWAAVAVSAASAVQGASEGRKARKLQEKSLEPAQIQADIAKEQWSNYKENYLPVEEQYTDVAKTGLDLGYQADRAGQDVRTAFSVQKQRAERDALRMGLDPSSAAYQDKMEDMATSEALASAGARTTARERGGLTNLSLKQNAISLGKGLASQASAGLNSAAAGFSNAANARQQSANGYGQFSGYMLNQGLNMMNNNNGGASGSGASNGGRDYTALGGSLN